MISVYRSPFDCIERRSVGSSRKEFWYHIICIESNRIERETPRNGIENKIEWLKSLNRISSFFGCETVRHRRRERAIKLIVHGKRRIFNLQCTETNGAIVRTMRNKIHDDESSMARAVFFVVVVYFAVLVSFTYIGSYISMNNASQFNVVTFTGMYPTSFNCYFRWCCIRMRTMWKNRKYSTRTNRDTNAPWKRQQ